MVQVEGQGKRAPASLDVVMPDGSLLQLLGEAKKRNEFRCYGARADQWGQGLTGGTVIANVGAIDEQTMPILAGFVGEEAVTFVIRRRAGVNVRVDFSKRQEGDGGKDIVANGLRIDVKTKVKEYTEFLIRHSTERGRVLPATADAFVFAWWNKGKVVKLHGYVTKEDLADMPIADALRGNHKNYEIQPTDLRPMSRLFDEIRSREWR